MRNAFFACCGLVSAATSFASDCSQTSVGTIPLNDLGPGSYLGFQGGLYPNGLNMRPPAHDAAGLALAQQIVPRNAAGAPSADGSIVMISIGMSNATMEFSVFVNLANADPAKHPKVVPVDCAQGGQTAQLISDPTAAYWSFVDSRLALAGKTAAQVQVVWLKEANQSPTGGFPAHAQTLQSQFVEILHILHTKFPNLRICYLASRIYAGYATSALNPEPVAYEQGFAVQWLIRDQINGDPALNYNVAQGPVLAPWLAWSSYNWADGLNARSDGLIWDCADFNPDGTHPSASGRLKVAQRLLDFVKTDATARPWFLANPLPLCAQQATESHYGAGAGGTNGITQLVVSDLLAVPTNTNVNVHAWNAPANSGGAFLFGVTPFAPGSVPMLGGSLLLSPLVVVPSITNSFGKASLPLGAIPASGTLCGAHVYFQFVVSDPNSLSGYDVTNGLDLRLGH